MGEVVSSIKIQETAFFAFQFKVVLVRLDAESVRTIPVSSKSIGFGNWNPIFSCIASYISVIIFCFVHP